MGCPLSDLVNCFTAMRSLPTVVAADSLLYSSASLNTPPLEALAKSALYPPW